MTPNLLQPGDIVETVTLTLEDQPPLNTGYVQETYPGGAAIRLLWRAPGKRRNLKDTDEDVILPFAGIKRLLGAYDSHSNRIRYFKGMG